MTKAILNLGGFKLGRIALPFATVLAGVAVLLNKLKPDIEAFSSLIY